jgi:hypothetical protein
MFAFVVETGSGLANATSYVSIAEADDYYVIDPNFSATWANLTLEVKQYLLAWATRILDQKSIWKGVLSVPDTQALRWPRTYVYDRDDRLIAPDSIPKQLKEATFELAKWLRANDPTEGQDVDYLKAMRVDVIEFEWQDNAAQQSVPSIINAILSPLGTFRTGGASRFGRIVKN